MSILAAYQAAFESADVNALENILHEDFTFTPHVGNAMSGFPGACMCEFTYGQLLYMANFYLTGTGTGNW